MIVAWGRACKGFAKIWKEKQKEKPQTPWHRSSVGIEALGDERIGEINDLVVGPTGQIETVIVGVGGFLGLGERDVAYPFGEVSIQRRADGSDLRVFVGTPESGVGDLPEYVRR